jgi:hyaluronate lyase
MIAVAGSGLTLANFFSAGSAGGFSVSGPSSLAVRTAEGRTTVALSDPSRTQAVARVTLPSAAGTSVVEADAGARVISTSPLTLEFDLDGHGHSKRIVLG